MRERLYAGALAFSLLASGCSPEATEGEMHQNTSFSTAAHRAEDFLPSLDEVDPARIVDLGQLPETLPSAIATEVDSAVKFSVVTGQDVTINQYGDKVPVPSIGEGSGVQIANNLFLTAGHVFKDSATHQPHLSAEVCGNVIIRIANNKMYNLGSNPDGTQVEFTGTKQYALKQWSSLVGYEVPSKQKYGDIAVVQADKLLGQDPDYVEISPTLPAINDPVYIVNYEPTIDGNIRSPFEADLIPSEVAKGLGEAAIYGGVVVGYNADGRIIIAEDLQSYGELTETQSRPGSSGGPVLNSKGELVGLTQSIFVESQASISKSYNVDFATPNPNSLMSLQLAQPVTPQIGKTLLSYISEAPYCHG